MLGIGPPISHLNPPWENTSPLVEALAGGDILSYQDIYSLPLIILFLKKIIYFIQKVKSYSEGVHFMQMVQTWLLQQKYSKRNSFCYIISILFFYHTMVIFVKDNNVNLKGKGKEFA